MRSLKLLLKRALLFSAKLALVGVLAAVVSFFSYRAGVRDTLKDYAELSSLVDKVVATSERQGHALDELHGEMNLLKMLAAARTGAGIPALPALPYQVPQPALVRSPPPGTTWGVGGPVVRMGVAQAEKSRIP